MGTLKLALVGAGAISGAHLEALKTIDEIEVVAIADIDPDRAKARAAKYNIPNTYVDADRVATTPILFRTRCLRTT